MERFSDLALVLKSFPYQERDRIVVFLTENHGKITGLAKGAVGSKRFGGALDFLICSKMRFVQKPHNELVRIEEAITHHEFKTLQKDLDKLTIASFAAEFCLRLLEPQTPLREVFICLSNMLFHLDQGLHSQLVVNAFLSKTFQALGYPPNLFRCVHCNSPVGRARCRRQLSDVGGDPQIKLHWSTKAGGVVCSGCISNFAGGSVVVHENTVLLCHKLMSQPFKNLTWDNSQDSVEAHQQLFQILSDFLHHHLPGVPPSGFRSWALMNQVFSKSNVQPDVNLGLPK